MKSRRRPGARWNTSSYGRLPDTTPQELSTLGEHLRVCRGSRGRFFALRAAGDSTRRFFAARFVTTFVLLALLTAVFAAVALLGG